MINGTGNCNGTGECNVNDPGQFAYWNTGGRRDGSPFG